MSDEIRARDMRRRVEADHHWESGNPTIGGSVFNGTDCRWTEHPAACDIRRLRAEDRALHQFGGRPPRSIPEIVLPIIRIGPQ